MHQLRILLFLMGLALCGLTSFAQADELTGAVLVQFPDGLAEADSDGSIVIRVRREGHATISVEGKIAGGRYTIELPTTGEFQVLATRTSEGAGYPVGGKRWIPIPKPRVFDVVVRIPQPFDLWVYGSDGRTQLEGITVMRCLRKFARLPNPAPGSNKFQQVFTGAASPIKFQLDTPEMYTYYVHAPGHAWTQISPDPFLGGVRTLRLPAGGDLQVQMIQAGPKRGRVFRVRSLDSSPDSHPLVHELKQYGDTVKVVGLPVGRYSASSEDPIRPWNMPVYGMAEFEITAGQLVDFKMDLSAEPVFQPVPAGGTVKIPAQWGQVSQLTMNLNRLDPYGNWGRSYQVPGTELAPLAGYPDVFQWSLPEVAPGAYSLSFAHTSFSVYREIHGAGQQNLHFELPAPRTVLVQTEDDRTGEAIYPENLIWSAIEPTAIRRKIRDTAPLVSERRFLAHLSDDVGFSIYGPDTPLRIRLDDPRFDMAELIIDGPGDQQVTWTLHRTTSIRLELQHAGNPVEWKGNVHILSESGHGKVLRASDFDGGHQYNLSDPGRYSIRFPKLAGFAPIPPQTVQVKDGELLVVKVALDSL